MTPTGKECIVYLISLFVLLAAFYYTVFLYEPPAIITNTTQAPITTTEQPTEATTAFEEYNVPLSINLQWYIENESAEYGIAPQLVFAIIEKESNFDTQAVGQAGELGLMQIHPINFDEVAEAKNAVKLLDAYQNCKAGIYLLNICIEETDTLDQALMMYNLGKTGANKQFSKGIYSTSYSRSIIENMEGI